MRPAISWPVTSGNGTSGNAALTKAGVGVAHAAGLDGDADLATAGLGHLVLDDTERASRLGDLCGSDH
jgi:hypothetical protein